MSASDRTAGETQITDAEVVAAAESLGEELAAAKESSSAFAFTTVVMQCNEAIGDATGIDYAGVCGVDEDGCC